MVAWTPRASDADRERVAEKLRRSWCEGYLSFETFSDRVDLAYRARSSKDLRRLVFDLPESPIRAVVRLWDRIAPAVAAEGTEDDPEAGELRFPDGADFTLVLGRALDCDCRLLDETVSRHHAEVRFEEGVAVIADLASKNGVYVNGRRVWRAEIRRGDHIGLGAAHLTVA